MTGMPPDDFFGDALSDARVPPHDMEAERAVVATVLLTETTSATRNVVRPAHFYSDANRRVYEGALALEADGKPVDIITLRGWLADNGHLERVGGAEYLAELLGVPTITNVADYAARVVDKATLRTTIAVMQRAAAEGYTATDPAALLLGARKELDGIDARQAEPIETISTSEIFDPQPPVPWVVPDLYLAPGRPCLVAGYGYSAKSVSCQALLLAIASGARVWGNYRVQRLGKVLHLDHEQGKRATLLRYQRLSRAMGIGPEDLEDRLRVAALPRKFRLSNSDAEDVLEAAVEGCSVCLIDSLRATIPGVDENDSVVREYLDKLLRISERTGCAFVVIHHAGKNGKDKSASERARGSSAIFDACGLVLQLDGKTQDDGSTMVGVTMTKAPADASGAALAPFFLRVSDVMDDGRNDERWGLACEYRNEEQVEPPKTVEEALNEVCEVVVQIIDGERRRCMMAREPFDGVSGNYIRGVYRGKDSKLITPALESLERIRRLESTKRPGRGGGLLWNLVEAE